MDGPGTSYGPGTKAQGSRTRLIAAFALVATTAAAQPASPPTFTSDVAPILWQECATCHRPEGIAPFSLIDYRDVVPRARQVADAVRRGSMPPWLPARGEHVFLGERRLSASAIDTITRWVAAGAPEGDRAARRMPPAASGTWRLGQPDLVVEVPAPYVLMRGSGDRFRNFAVPVPVAAARWVRGIEIDPGDASVVHHASISLDRSRASRRLDESDPLPGFSGGMFAEAAESPDSRALGWTPGMTPHAEPEGMAWRLPTNADLVIQLHMIPAADRDVAVRPRVAFYFQDAPPTRLSVDVRLGSRDIDIAPGDADFAITDAFTLPAEATLMSVYPHAHYLAKEMTAAAQFPDGRTTILLTIPRWDFHWQEEYRFAQPLALPRGTVVRMRYTYDNSAAQWRRAAGAAPGPVIYGPMSSNEMGDLWLRLSPASPEAAAALARAYVEHERTNTLALNQRQVVRHPESAAAHNALGASYLDAGRTGDGIEQLQIALRLDPKLAEAHNNLAQAWRRTGKPREAIVESTRAVDLAPANPVAQLNHGNALLDNGDLVEAIAAFERALALNPSLAEAHNNLGIALGALGRIDEAERHFRDALEIQPDDPDAIRNLELVKNRR